MGSEKESSLMARNEQLVYIQNILPQLYFVFSRESPSFQFWSHVTLIAPSSHCGLRDVFELRHSVFPSPINFPSFMLKAPPSCQTKGWGRSGQCSVCLVPSMSQTCTAWHPWNKPRNTVKQVFPAVRQSVREQHHFTQRSHPLPATFR